MNKKCKGREILSSTLLAVAFSLGVANLRAQESRKVIYNPAPVYPETAKRLRLTGVVKVQIVVGPDGHIKETNIIGGHPVLVGVVEEALKSWKYAPSSGETTAQLEFRFHP